MIAEKVAGANTTYEQDAQSEKPIRSIAKAMSWRVVGTIDTFIVSYLVLGEGSLGNASIITAIDFINKLILYFFHERAWNKIKWGR